ncbi:hypothetical protein AB0O75_46785 [Streptomyces sp. NPDC088921]|uniref:hypothetical protein n=1 Tax=unclassified Streptomyces TaxID=2593676 RepID=UPI00344834A1
MTAAQAYIADAKERLERSGAELANFIQGMHWLGKASETFKRAMSDYDANYQQVLTDLQDIQNGVETARGHTTRAAEETEAVAGQLSAALGATSPGTPGLTALGATSPGTPGLPLTSDADGSAVIGASFSPMTPGGAVANSPSTPGGGLNLL